MQDQTARKEYDVIVVGAGASGLLAAGRVAEGGGSVLLVEKMKQAGRKLLITGKGRCNLSSDASLDEYYENIYPDGRYLKDAFSRFFSQDIIRLLSSQGLETIKERGKRIFPVSNNAADVLKALMKWLNSYPIDFTYQSRAEEILISRGRIRGVRINRNGKKEEIRSKNLILCTGGLSYPGTGSTGDGYRLAGAAGHSITDLRPSLVPLVTGGRLAARLTGLHLRNVRATVMVNNKKIREEFGEMDFTNYGLTGPIILSLSRFVVDELRNNRKVNLSLDLKPALDENKLEDRLSRDLGSRGRESIEKNFRAWLPSRLIPVFLEQLKINRQKPGHTITAGERRSIMKLMKNLTFEVVGHRGYKEAIITAGGVSTDEIDKKSMQSRLIENLYFAGEIIDLDGNTGGFNLQIAYSTAWLAAESCLMNLTNKSHETENN